jgi:hypothetical protein
VPLPECTFELSLDLWDSPPPSLRLLHLFFTSEDTLKLTSFKQGTFPIQDPCIHGPAAFLGFRVAAACGQRVRRLALKDTNVDSYLQSQLRSSVVDA